MVSGESLASGWLLTAHGVLVLAERALWIEGIEREVGMEDGFQVFESVDLSMGGPVNNFRQKLGGLCF
ncbi:hypothetical protein MRB53_017729 [Persea americana]|uniref:Uncharacterized protein n=1 Tax=Persea americana TaxID=3435 RepID=A0ACC2M5X8_PERAE|nr:hypothetical protein MRB53_017729 [Persea americana]